jgi:integrase
MSGGCFSWRLDWRNPKLRSGCGPARLSPDYFVQGRRSWIRLREKGGKRHDVPVNYNLDEYLEIYIDHAGIGADSKGPPFRTVFGKTDRLMRRPMTHADAYRIVRRRAKAAGIHTKIGNRTFRATGITAYLKNGGQFEVAQQIAADESSRTTGLYDRPSGLLIEGPIYASERASSPTLRRSEASNAVGSTL